MPYLPHLFLFAAGAASLLVFLTSPAVLGCCG